MNNTWMFSIFCLGSAFIAVLILGFILLWRFIAYKENMAYAEKGLLPPQHASNGRGALIWGILIAAVGLALCLGLWPLGMSSRVWPLGMGPWMLGGLLPLFFGLALILVYVLTRRDEPSKKTDVPQEPPIENQ